MTIKVQNKGTLDALRMIQQATEPALTDVLNKHADKVGAAAVKEAPVDTGHLRGSWFTKDVVKAQAGKLVKIVGFNAMYAFFVHNNLNAKHENGTKAMFLTDPILRLASDLTSAAAKAVERVLRSMSRGG